MARLWRMMVFTLEVATMQLTLALTSLRNEAVYQCHRKLTEPGRYTFDVTATPLQQTYKLSCFAKFQAPPGHVIRFNFEKLSVACDSPYHKIKVLDGWLMSLNTPAYFIPQELAYDGDRLAQLCSVDNDTTITESQNFAEILYMLQPDESFVVNVEFVASSESDKRACNALVDASQSGTYRMHLMGGESEECRIYVSGPTALRVIRSEFSEQECETNPPRLTLSRSWQWNKVDKNSRVSCEGTACVKKKYRLPCKHSTIQLATTAGEGKCGGVETDVIIELRQLSGRDAWLHAYDCDS